MKKIVCDGSGLSPTRPHDISVMELHGALNMLFCRKCGYGVLAEYVKNEFLEVAPDFDYNLIS